MLLYKMGLYIRLNNQFVLKKGKKYFLTDIKKVSEWKGLTSKQKELLKEFVGSGAPKGPQTDSFTAKLKRFWKQ